MLPLLLLLLLLISQQVTADDAPKVATSGTRRALSQVKAGDEQAAGAAVSSPPAILIGAHYFAGWYLCAGKANCTGHISGYTPTGTPTANWFDFYPSRIPLLGNLTTDEATVAAETA